MPRDTTLNSMLNSMINSCLPSDFSHTVRGFCCSPYNCMRQSPPGGTGLQSCDWENIFSLTAVRLSEKSLGVRICTTYWYTVLVLYMYHRSWITPLSSLSSLFHLGTAVLQVVPYRTGTCTVRYVQCIRTVQSSTST